MCRSDELQIDGGVIESSNRVDKRQVVGLSCVKVWAVHPVDKWINYVRETDVDLWVKPLKQQWQDILGADPLESRSAAVVIWIALVYQLLEGVPTIASGHDAPNAIHEVGCLRPANMTIAADHVIDKDDAFSAEACLHLGKERLQLDDMMERVISEIDVGIFVRTPRVQISCDTMNSIAYPETEGVGPRAVEHLWIQLEEHELKVFDSSLMQSFRDAQLGIPVSGSQAN
jgi:hypothetical protein